jgi:hypothetical protein
MDAIDRFGFYGFPETLHQNIIVTATDITKSDKHVMLGEQFVCSVFQLR